MTANLVLPELLPRKSTFVACATKGMDLDARKFVSITFKRKERQNHLQIERARYFKLRSNFLSNNFTFCDHPNASEIG